ncbi:uncharacterized protein AB9W97_006952 isoform 1-T1 [Spinachia spinachia]
MAAGGSTASQTTVTARHPPAVSQKVQLTFKLFMLEIARNALEQELLNLTDKAYEDVRGFLNSTIPTVDVFSDLVKALDTKYQNIDKLCGLLKDLTVETPDYGQSAVKKKVRAYTHIPLGEKKIQMKEALKFGSMLDNSLMATSITKAVQVLGATLIDQQYNIQCNLSSSYSSAGATLCSTSCIQAEEKENSVFIEEKLPSDAAILASAIIERPENNPERPPLPLPPIQAILPEISNPRPTKIKPLMNWGCEEDVQVQHQKQTSSQLLHFLRAKAKNTGALEVTVMKRCESMCASNLPPQPIKKQSYQFRPVVTDHLIDALAPKTLCADIEYQAPVFIVKKVQSSGSRTYTLVIATKTELWDIGDILTEVGCGESEAHPWDNKACPNRTAQGDSSPNIQLKTQTLQCTEPEHVRHVADAKRPAVHCITIPDFHIRRFEETEVVVSCIVSPGHFYVQHADSVVTLQALFADSWKVGSSYAEPSCIPDIGAKVMGWFPKHKQWCRVQVTKICGVSGDNNATDGAGSGTSIKLEVKKLDYGDTACLSLLNIKEMTPEMAVLPLQAVKVSLENVTPVNGSDWSEEAAGWFKAMVHNRTLYARLYPQGPEVTVELFLEKGKLGAMRRGASLSLRLAQNGHAKHNKLRNLGLVKCTTHLKRKKLESEWVKYLISCYTQSKK